MNITLPTEMDETKARGGGGKEKEFVKKQRETNLFVSYSFHFFFYFPSFFFLFFFLFFAWNENNESDLRSRYEKRFLKSVNLTLSTCMVESRSHEDITFFV